MSTIPVRTVVSTSNRKPFPAIVSEACWHCGTPIPSDGKSDPHLCAGCVELGRNSAVHDAFATVQAIRRGDGPLFRGLHDAEKLALLNEILGTEGQDLRTLGSDALVKLAADTADEIARRLGSVEPSPAERARIEAESQDDPHPDGIVARRVFVQ